MEMKIRLSMPSTTSMTTRVANASQAAGSESRTSMSCMAGSIMWPRSPSIQPFLSAVEPLSPLPMSSPAAPARPTPNLAIVFLSVAAFASAANMRVIDPLLVQLCAPFHVTVGEASIAATVFLFANGVFVLVYGPFGDRYGMMPVVAIACTAAALCCGLSALAGSLAWLTLARFLTGVTSSAIIPLAIAWVGDNVSYERRQATLARFLRRQTLGLMPGAAACGAGARLRGPRNAPAAR